MEAVGRGLRLVTLMVASDGFYKMSRLHVSPDSFFFKVRLLVLDSFRCSRPCPDLRLGRRRDVGHNLSIPHHQTWKKYTYGN